MTSSPAGWKEVRLGDLGPLSKGVGIRKNEVTPYGIPCVRYGQIYTEYNFVIGEIQTFVSPQVASNSRPLRKGEILFAGSGETKEDIGKCIAYVEDVGAVAGGDIVILSPEGADSRFLGYLLNSPNVAKQKTSRAQGDAVVHISAANLASIVLDLPPLNEQEAIAEALSDADAAIESLDAMIAKKRDVKQATMQQLLTGRTRLPGFDADWKEVRLREVAEVDPENLSAATSPFYEFNYISLESVSKGRLVGFSEQVFHAAPSRARRILKDLDVLLATVRPNLLGHLLFRGDNNWIGSTGFAVVRCKSDLYCPTFMCQLVFSHVIQAQIELLITGSNYPAINSKDVRELCVPMPPLREQEAIASVLTVMDDELEALTQQVLKLRMVKQGMMQDLLTGKVRLV